MSAFHLAKVNVIQALPSHSYNLILSCSVYRSDAWFSLVHRLHVIFKTEKATSNKTESLQELKTLM